MSYRSGQYRQQGWGSIGSYILSLIFLSIFFLYSSQTFEFLGFSPFIALGILFLSVLGSSINIPITEIESENLKQSNYTISFWGITYNIPGPRIRNKSLIAINVGGGIIPLSISSYLLITNPNAILYTIGPLIIASGIIYYFSRPVPGLGIAVPFIVPAFSATVLTVIFASTVPNIAPIVAYVTGTVGSLIGADILNLKKIPDLGAPVASIGGAGTFDGIFIAGIFAVGFLTFFGFF